MPYESWIERQIRESIERGEFDNLPGAGEPIPGLNGRDEPDWWVRSFLEREKISMPLPTSLALRGRWPSCQRRSPTSRRGHGPADRRRTQARIADSHRRTVDGPPIVVAQVDVDAVIEAGGETGAR